MLRESPKNPTKTSDFFTVAVSPKNADFDTDIRGEADGTEWKELFGADNKYSGH